MTLSALFRSLPALQIRDPMLRLLQAAELQRSRRALARLDDHLLRDIGLTRAEAEAEVRRGTWDAPLHWRD